ncbi:hypothetical protein GCM10018781_20410 [Kitasatospora indigofera]|uniref:Uncharacterized protein n=1 Tax=Kitasatospora indigofera TaxID=67307 RepID=A0A919FJF9_9ACTN|nr:hypothetical protein GCM10018781_20410 [Kitasatospora indigofera]
MRRTQGRTPRAATALVGRAPGPPGASAPYQDYASRDLTARQVTAEGRWMPIRLATERMRRLVACCGR